MTRECFCLLGTGIKELGVVFETSSTGIFEEKESISGEYKAGGLEVKE